MQSVRLITFLHARQRLEQGQHGCAELRNLVVFVFEIAPKVSRYSVKVAMRERAALFSNESNHSIQITANIEGTVTIRRTLPADWGQKLSTTGVNQMQGGRENEQLTTTVVGPEHLHVVKRLGFFFIRAGLVPLEIQPASGIVFNDTLTTNMNPRGIKMDHKGRW